MMRMGEAEAWVPGAALSGGLTGTAPLAPGATGVYSNFLEDEGEARIHEAYPGATYERLAEVKRHYDPDNVFRSNYNIAPA